MLRRFDFKMLTGFTYSFLALIYGGLASEDLEMPLKARGTWSFELVSLDEFVEYAIPTVNETREELRGATAYSWNCDRESCDIRMKKKIGDPEWLTDPSKVPRSFDAREKWKDCSPLISQVGDEGPCVTDAPLIVSSIVSDRTCIFTNATRKERLSQEMLMACGALCTRQPIIAAAWNYAVSSGIPTGGSNGSNEGCLPYEFAPCFHDNYTYIPEHHGRKELEPCSKQFIYDQDCPKNCSNEQYGIALDADLRKCWFFLPIDEFTIKNEILAHGPVAASVRLHSDFLERPNGVFQKKPDREKLAPYKYLKIIGWGEENNVKYWLCVNSWDTWGDKVIKFPRGTNYDLIELFVTAGYFDPAMRKQ